MSKKISDQDISNLQFTKALNINIREDIYKLQELENENKTLRFRITQNETKYEETKESMKKSQYYLDDINSHVESKEKNLIILMQKEIYKLTLEAKESDENCRVNAQKIIVLEEKLNVVTNEDK